MGAGSVIAGMIQSFNSNRNQLKQRRRAFNKEDPHNRELNGTQAIQDKKVSDSEMLRIKQKIHDQKRQERTRATIIIIIIALLVSGIMWFIGH